MVAVGADEPNSMPTLKLANTPNVLTRIAVAYQGHTPIEVREECPPARFGPFDCSGSVSYVIQQAGYRVPTTVSGDIPIWKFPAGPGRVTIFYNPVHTFMRVGDRFFGTSGFARPGGGAGWFDVNRLPAGYLSQFQEVHVPKLGTNSFAPSHLGQADS